jgi:hypothetical protein
MLFQIVELQHFLRIYVVSLYYDFVLHPEHAFTSRPATLLLPNRAPVFLDGIYVSA